MMESVLLLFTSVSTYYLVAPSLFAVGVAKLVILCELSDPLPVGAVMLLRVVELA